jgi:uncharacterized protein (UPF0335 family)
MEDRLKDLMQELGKAINDSLSDSNLIASAIAEIKRAGYDVFMTLESTIGFKKREDGKESSKAAATAEVVSTGASFPDNGSTIPNLKSGNFAVLFKQAGLNEGTPTPLPAPSTSPQPPTAAPTALAAVLKTDDRLKKLMQELGNAINGSLSDSDRITAVIAEMKRAGYDVSVTMEATIGFNKRDEAKSPETAATAEVVATGAVAPYPSKTPTSGKVTGPAVQIQMTSPRQKVTVTDGTLQVYQARDFSSTVILQLARGSEIELGASQIFDGREWIEANLGNGSVGYVLGPSVRSHTNLGKRALPTRPPATPAPRAASRAVEALPSHGQSTPSQKARQEADPPRREVAVPAPTPSRAPAPVPPPAAAPSPAPAPASRSEIKSEVLLHSASPDLFRMNAFRITGLPVDATASQINSHVEKLRLAEKFGGARPRTRRAFSIEPPPDADQLRAAMQRLHDPEARLVDEFFWFWPHELGSANGDAALAALEQGNDQHAAEIWSEIEAHHSVSNVSMHNLAVMSQLRVLDLEQTPQAGEMDPKEAAARADMWRAAFRRWKVLLENEAFWSRLTARIHALDDPRLTTGTSRRMRESLPLALLLINAQLALRAAQAGNEADAKRQLAVLRDSGFDRKIVGEALHRVVEPLRERIKTMCQSAAREVSDEAQNADSTTRRLFEYSRPVLAVIDGLLPAGDPVRDGAHDEVALQALEAQIPFVRKTQNWKTFVELLEKALAIAASASAIARIEENLRIGRDEKQLGTCFFCEDLPTEKSAEIAVPMHGNVKRQPAGYNKIETTWNHATIRVPRCAACAAAHEKHSQALGNVAWVAWVSCLAYIVVLCFIGGLVWEGLGPFACILGGLATWIVPSMMARAAAYIWLERTKPVTEQYGFFAIQKRKEEGWRLEDKPPGAPVPSVGLSTGTTPPLARWAFFRRQVLAGNNVQIRVWVPSLIGLILLPTLLGLASGEANATRFMARAGLISARTALVRLTPELEGENGFKTFVVLKPLLHAPGIEPAVAVAALEKALSDKGAKKDERLCVEAAKELAIMGASSRVAVPTLEFAALDPRESVGDAAADTLRQVDPERATAWAITNLESPAIPIRRRAVLVLEAGVSVGNEAIPALMKATENSDASVRTAAMQALAKTAPDVYSQRVLGKLIRQLRNGSRGVRENAAEQLGTLGSAAKEALPELDKAAQGSDPEVRSFAKEAAARVRLAK